MAINKPNIFYAWAESGGVTNPGVAKIQEGWNSEVPTFQNFNWLLNRQDVFNQHVNERGTPLHDTVTPYVKDSLAMGSDGYIYKSLIDPNTGNDPVTDNGANWVLDVEDNQWFNSGGGVPSFASSDTVIFSGQDLRALYPVDTRLTLKGPATGVIFGEVQTVIFLGGDTRVQISIDENKVLSNEVYDYIKTSTQNKSKTNLPYGLSGLDNRSLITNNGIVRRVPLNTPGGSKHKLLVTPSDVYSKRGVTSDTATVLDEPGFFNITTFGTALSIRFSNTSGKTLTVRHRINKAAWQVSSVVDTGNFDLAIGADGMVEIQVCNKEITDTKMLNFYAETDSTVNLFSYISLTKNYFYT